MGERRRSFLFLQMHYWIISSDYSGCLILRLYEQHCSDELGRVVFHPCSLIVFFKCGRVTSCIFCGFVCVCIGGCIARLVVYRNLDGCMTLLGVVLLGLLKIDKVGVARLHAYSCHCLVIYFAGA
ncbi:hypothetical protein VPH35_120523 [Triticum aestivum]